MKQNLITHFNDILEAINEVESFIKQTSWNEFKNDKKTIRAVERDIGIIGEVVYDMSEEFKEKYKDRPWRDIEKMRHLLIHHYGKVDVRRVWDTARNELPGLKKQIYSLYEKEIEKEKWR